MKHSTKLILGSGSPRRIELLRDAGFTFKVERVDFDEIFPEDILPDDVAKFLAIGKNKAYRESHKDAVIITADTVVISNGEILGKPKDEKDAINMLSSLSGTFHKVVTGVCVSSTEYVHSFSVHTKVKVKPLSIKEINHYIAQFQPFDKAGAYGIQEWFGLIAIESIEGSYYNVVGLPIHEVYQVLTEEFDISPIK